MNHLGILLKKEWREHLRNFKILWIPLVFIILGMLEPVTNHFLPEIMKKVGNLPEDAEFLWPQLKGEDIFYSLVGQYQFIGVLLIILAFMGSISGERKNGTATLLYVRPISYRTYFLSKWIMCNGIALSSVWLGFFAAWYYIEILYNSVDVSLTLAFIGTYSLWIIFVVTIVLALSAWLPSGGVAGFSIFVTIIYPIIDSIVGMYWSVSPWKLPTYASYWFQANPNMSDLWLSACVTAGAIVFLFIFGVVMSSRNASKTTV